MSKPMNVEEFKICLNTKHNGNIELIEYGGSASKKSRFKCLICNREWSTKGTQVISQNTGCSHCNHIGEKHPIISFEEVKTRIFSLHGDKIQILEYSGMNRKGKFICNEGHTWMANVSSVCTSNGCPICSKRIKHSLSFVSEYMGKYGCVLLSTEYKNLQSKLFVQYSCGHIGEISFANFKKGKRCRQCSMKKSGVNHRISRDEIIKTIESKGYIFIEFVGGYFGISNSIISYKCPCGFLNIRPAQSIYHDLFCLDCAKEERILKYSRENSPGWKGGTTPLIIYLNKQIYEWKKESMENCKYKCVITGDRFDAIHHIYSKNMIIREALIETGLEIKRKIQDYSEKELLLLVNTFRNLHKLHPLGVCLRKDIHDLFHKIYGSGNNTPEQWNDFVNKIKNKEIDIGEEVII